MYRFVKPWRHFAVGDELDTTPGVGNTLRMMGIVEPVMQSPKRGRPRKDG